MKLDKPEELKRLKPNWKANNDWQFLFSLAKELGKTVAELSDTLTVEEMIGWAAYAEIEHEDFEKAQQEAQRGSALKGKRGRMR